MMWKILVLALALGANAIDVDRLVDEAERNFRAELMDQLVEGRKMTHSRRKFTPE